MHKLDKKVVQAMQGSDEMVHALKQVIQGVLIAECGALKLVDITTHELKKDINILMTVAKRIQANMIKNCPGSDDIFNRYFRGNEIGVAAELCVTVLGFTADTIENIDVELKSMLAKEKQKENIEHGETIQ